MKKLLVFLFIIALTLVCTLDLFGCSNSQDISEDLVEEEGLQYLTLPISKKKVQIWGECKQFVANIDVELLIAAEEKIIAQTRNSERPAGFGLQVKDGHMYLNAEVIETIDPPKIKTTEDGYVVENGCDIDHRHVFFTERITK